MERPKLIIALNAGVIDGVYCDLPLSVIVVDVDEYAEKPVKILHDYDEGTLEEFAVHYESEIDDCPELKAFL